MDMFKKQKGAATAGIGRVIILGLFLIGINACTSIGHAQLPLEPTYARTPYQYSQGFSNLPASQLVTFPRLPRGQLLVIENVSFYVYAGGSQQRITELQLVTTIGGNAVTHHLETPESFTIVASATIGYAMSRSLRLYTSEPLKVSFSLKDGASLGGGTISITGYLVPIGAPSLSP